MKLYLVKGHSTGKKPKFKKITEYQFNVGSISYLPEKKIGSFASDRSGGLAMFWSKSKSKPVLTLVFASIVEATQNRIVFNGVEVANLGAEMSLGDFGDYVLLLEIDNAESKVYDQKGL